jgi:hypothetical protein
LRALERTILAIWAIWNMYITAIWYILRPIGNYFINKNLAILIHTDEKNRNGVLCFPGKMAASTFIKWPIKAETAKNDP